MVILVESNFQFEQFMVQYEQSDCIIIPILLDVNKHPCNNSISCIYIKLLQSAQEYLLPFNHGETQNISGDRLYDLNVSTKKYTYNKKELNHIIKLDNVIDVNMLFYLQKNIPLKITNLKSSAHDFFKSLNQLNINRIIPILKHLEYCRNITELLEPVIEFEENSFYNDIVINSLSDIESNGIYYDGNLIYSEYNLYTKTGRPSNRYGGMNFAALNKDDNSRVPFTSRFEDDGILMEFDYQAYHPRLIAKLINYSFPQEIDVYEYFAKQFKVDDRNIAKNLVFKYQYGNIPDEIKTIKYFRHLDSYIQTLWDSFNIDGYVSSYIFNKKFFIDNLEDMNKNKLVNYLLQNFETEYNMVMLSELLSALDEYESKIVLYGYDSILIDVKLNEKDKINNIVSQIMTRDGEFPIGITMGNNYHQMKSI